MKKSATCALLILGVAIILGIGIWLTTFSASPAKTLMRKHPYEFSELKEWGKEKRDRYTKDGGCVFISYPKTNNKETMKVIEGFSAEAKARFKEFSATEEEGIPRLAIDYTAEKKDGYSALTLTAAIGRYTKEGEGKDTILSAKTLYIGEKNAILDLEGLLGAENHEKLGILLERRRLSEEDLEGFTYSKEQVTMQWADEEAIFTMEEIERAGKIDPAKPMIALTFDDGPGRLTKDFADLLTKYNGHGTFFMLGTNVVNFEENVKYAYEQGHEIASHTMRHKNLNVISSSAVEKEISDADAAIEKVTGQKPKLVRAPYGNANSTVRSIINRPVIHWSLDTEDWRSRNAAAVKNAILENVSDGAIILMHEIYQSTYDGLELAIEELVNQGYQLVTVSELMEFRCEEAGIETYHSFPPQN